ncbi:acyl carrier protein [Streptomyces boncukensis]|uniref:Acyl carrier protein n=1 Tax=Streptomyces boncukensis TaxID=2711219 RepID=A0A6G4WZI8_9ACTN|nr:acyl carrier protein [Streptomyces boncukensis]NGO70282.1 acyl carrier protein [Streptomyces boncukensis]
MTIDDLRRFLAECAGEDETVDLAGDTLDTPFGDLGYDSLALMETATRIEQELGISVPEEEFTGTATPRSVLLAVESAAAGTAA